MKRIIFLSVALTALLSLNANAQTSQTTLNVRLHPIQTILVNTAQNTVNLDYVTSANYKDGVDIDQPDHLTVYSTGAFTVTVNSSTDKLTNAAFSADNIESSDITITAKAGTTKPLTGAVPTSVKLGTTAQPLITSDKGGNNVTFDINYAARGNDEYLNKYHKEESPTVYTTNVTYTIAAK